MPLLKGPALPIDIVELRVPIRMPGPFAGFAQPLHSVVQIFLQDLAHGVGADPVALAAQLVHDVGQAFRDPPQRLHRIPARGRVDNLLDPGPQFRMLGEDGFSAYHRATLSASDQIAVWVAGGGWQFALALHDGLATDRQRFGYGPHSSPSKRKRLIRRPQSRSALSQMWLQPLIFFSYDPFPFLPHLPVQPQIFLFAASPIVLGHPWDPPFCRVSQYALPRDRRFVQPNRSVGSYFFKAPRNRESASWSPFPPARLCGASCSGEALAQRNWGSPRTPQCLCYPHLCQGRPGWVGRGGELRSRRSLMKLSETVNQYVTHKQSMGMRCCTEKRT